MPETHGFFILHIAAIIAMLVIVGQYFSAGRRYQLKSSHNDHRETAMESGPSPLMVSLGVPSLVRKRLSSGWGCEERQPVRTRVAQALRDLLGPKGKIIS